MKNIIFDIGGVILNWDLDEMYNYFTDKEEEKQFIYENIFDSDEWIKGGLIDLGIISQYDFVDRIKEKTNHTNDKLVEDFILYYYKTLHVKEEVVNLISDLKDKGYNVYVLSNINDYIIDKTGAKRFLDLTDGYVLSYQVNAIKPNEEIYKILIDKYNLNPNESLFIDDIDKNIETANKLGIKGRKVIKNSYEDIINVLKEYKVL